MFKFAIVLFCSMPLLSFAADFSPFYQMPLGEVTEEGLRVRKNHSNLKINIENGAGTISIPDGYGLRVVKNDNKVKSIVEISRTAKGDQEATASQFSPDGTMTSQTSCGFKLDLMLNKKVKMMPGCVSINPVVCKNLFKYFGDSEKAEKEVKSCLETTSKIWDTVFAFKHKEQDELRESSETNLLLIAELNNDIATKSNEKLNPSEFRSNSHITETAQASSSIVMLRQMSKLISMCETSSRNWHKATETLSLPKSKGAKQE